MQPQRKDSARNRESIIDAAEQIFVENGDASFAEISIRAGLAQATVYRHFRDRSELVAEMLSRGLARLEATTESWRLTADSFEDLLRLMAVEQARYQGMIAEVRRRTVDESIVEQMKLRTEALFRAPLAKAKEEGRISQRLDTAGVIEVLSMIDGAIAPHPTLVLREAAGRRAVDIVLDGLRLTGEG